jgi:hypothetical protein
MTRPDRASGVAKAEFIVSLSKGDRVVRVDCDIKSLAAQE